MSYSKILTYRCEENDIPGLKWMGYILKAGNILPLRFNGETKDQVIKKADTWYKSQQNIKAAPVHIQDVTEEAYAEYLQAKPVPEIKKVFPSQKTPTGPGRGHGNAGRIWVVNPKTKDRKRIQESELNEYIGNGYRKGKKI